MMRIVEVCSGIGGLSRAAEAAGHTIVAHVEREPFCCAVLKKHWPDVPILSDLYDVRGDEYERPDMLMGGVPCQPFSEAGKKQGARDPRHLWPEMYRLVQVNHPEWVVVENVRGFITQGAFDLIASDLESSGYEVTATLLSAYLSGAPQQRERVFIVAHTQRFEHSWPEALAYGYDDLWRQYDTAARQQSADSSHARDPLVQRSTSPGERDREHRVDGDATGIPYGIFGHQFPALVGQPAYSYEPPRSVERSTRDEAMDNRRMRALGNAVVAQQAYPVFAAINWITAYESIS